MAKSADAFRTISEVAEWLDTPAHVLRFWESKFTQVKPVKRAGGRRYYRPQDMRLLGGIKKLLHDDGMTIKGVQKLLRENGVKHVSSLSPPLAGEEDTAYTYETGAGAPETATPEPAQVLDFRPRSEDPAPEPSAPPEDTAPPAAEPAPPQRNLTLTHSVPQGPPQDPVPDAPAAPAPPVDDLAPDTGDSAATPPPPPEDESGAGPQDAAPDTPPAEPGHDIDDAAQAAPDAGDDTDPQAAPGPDDAPDPAPPVKTGLPSFLNRPPAETGSPVDEGRAEPPADTPEPLAPRTPRMSLAVDVPEDPTDDAFITPGPLSVLAEVPRPFPGHVIRAIRPLSKRLRKILDETDET